MFIVLSFVISLFLPWRWPLTCVITFQVLAHYVRLFCRTICIYAIHAACTVLLSYCSRLFCLLLLSRCAMINLIYPNRLCTLYGHDSHMWPDAVACIFFISSESSQKYVIGCSRMHLSIESSQTYGLAVAACIFFILCKSHRVSLIAYLYASYSHWLFYPVSLKCQVHGISNTCSHLAAV